MRGRQHFSRFDPRPRRPHFSNFGPPARRGVTGKRPGLAAWVGHEGWWATLAGLVPICPGAL
eukprot:scaffold10965_cov57-Phaeocystis_antarctica.AAC.2